MSNSIDKSLLSKVIIHELYHCYEFSNIAYDLPVYYEEYVADFMATYGDKLLRQAKNIWRNIYPYKR